MDENADWESCHDRTIIHIDIDCFYAQVEMVKNPDLKDKPVGIKQKTILVTCNYKARSFGVTKCMLIKTALSLCPDLVIVNGEDLSCYRKTSHNITSLIQELFTPKVERLGFDENIIDATCLISSYIKEQKQIKSTGFVFDDKNNEICDCGCHKRIEYGSLLAQEMREAIYDRFGITSCAGIAHNKLLSKLVGSLHKPNQQTMLYPSSAMRLMETLKSVRDIPGIGTAMEKRLVEKSICTIGDLQNCSLEALTEFTGKEIAEKLKKLSFGIDDSPVIPASKPKSHGIEDAFKMGCSYEDCVTKISHMARKLLERVADDGRMPQTIRLTIRKKYGMPRESKQMTIPYEITKCLKNGEIEAAHSKSVSTLTKLFDTLVNYEPASLTLIGITLTKMDEPSPKNSANIQSYFTKQDKPSQTQSSSSSDTTPTSKRRKLEPKKTSILDKFCQIPPNVDKTVFKELPAELQQELIQTWYNERLSK